MANEVDIILKATDQASSVINKADDSLDGMGKSSRGASMGLTELSSAIGLVERGLGYAKQAFDQTVGATVDYANEVRGLQQITGASAEETSALIQVLDDFKVSSEAAANAQRYLTKEGITLTTSSLADLSEQYLAITNQADKNAFAQKMLGRNYKDFIEVLQQGPDAIRAMSDAVDENLILTQDAIAETRKYEMQIDDLGDTFQGFKIKVGTEALPVVTRALKELTDNIDESGAALGIFRFGWDDVARAVFGGSEAADSAERSYTAMAASIKDTSLSTEELEQQQKDLEAAIKATTEANNGLLSLTMRIQSENDNYSASLETLNGKQADLQGNLDTLISQGWSPYSEKVRDAQKALDDNAAAVQALADKHQDAMARIAYDLYVTKLQADGFTDAEFNMALQAGITAGVLDQATVDMARAMNDTATAAADAAGSVDTLGASVNNLPSEKNIKITTTYVEDVYTREGIAGRAGGSPAGGDGGLRWVGETGPELVNLPGGSNVASSPQSKAAADNSELIAAIRASKINPYQLARAFRDVMDQRGA